MPWNRSTSRRSSPWPGPPRGSCGRSFRGCWSGWRDKLSDEADHRAVLARGGIMSNKEAVMEIVRKMPEEVTLEEILEEIQILAAIRRGEEAVREGRVVSYDEVK